jgi:simple sugar transport system permease protein
MAILVRTLIMAVLLCAIILAVVLPAVIRLPDPGAALWTFIAGPLSAPRYFGNVLEYATPVLLTGLGAALMFRAGMFNIGVEGAFFLGAFLTAATIFTLPFGGWIAIPLALLVGALGGSLVCAIPGALKVRFDASELVTSLMFNFIALYVGLFLLNYFFRDPTAGALATARLPADVKLPRLIEGTRVHLGLVIALAICIVAGILLFTSRAGFRTRVVGANPGFAAHLGLNTGSILFRVQLLGGALAALGGGIELLGIYPRFSWPALPGQGWTGITVAILARNNPFLVIPAALFMSYLQTGGDLLARNYDVPSELVGLIQALVILGVSADYLMRNPALGRWLAARSTRRSGTEAPAP